MHHSSWPRPHEEPPLTSLHDREKSGTHRLATCSCPPGSRCARGADPSSRFMPRGTSQRQRRGRRVAKLVGRAPHRPDRACPRAINLAEPPHQTRPPARAGSRGGSPNLWRALPAVPAFGHGPAATAPRALRAVRLPPRGFALGPAISAFEQARGCRSRGSAPDVDGEQRPRSRSRETAPVISGDSTQRLR